MSFFIHLLLIGLRRLWRLWLWICFSVCLFILSLSLLFLELPTHQASIEQWLSTTLSQPVTIGRMTTYWTGFKPTIALYHLQVLEPNHQKSILEIGYIEIQINLIDSIKQKQLLTAGIILSQAQLTLAQNRAGQINLAGLQSQPNENNKNNEKLRHWLSLQPHFSLHAHRLTWQISQQDSFVFVNPHLVLQRQPEGYQMTAQISLPQQIISPLQRGTILFEGSSHWDNNRLTLLTGQIIAQQFQLVTKQHLLKLPHLQGQLTVRPSRNKTWQIAIKKLRLNHLQPPVNNELN
ncbi:MAG: hypothetical protein BWK79_19135 [Beggiatoa sp. IS2]|nr:MAG: hypothetical protein BWK79_19135 [Beggiatoa sp. IS2]